MQDEAEHSKSRIIYLLIQCVMEQLTLVLSFLEQNAPPMVGAAPKGMVGITVHTNIRMHI